MKISICWFRRDLRLDDNTALHHALESDLPVMALFIFDRNILHELDADDPRVTFIHQNLRSIHERLKKYGSSLLVLHGDPVKIWKELTVRYEIGKVFVNRDYEPYALERDLKVELLVSKKNIQWHSCKDQVIFEKNEILKKDGSPYTVFTPYKNRWLQQFKTNASMTPGNSRSGAFLKFDHAFPELGAIGFQESAIKVREYDLSGLDDYADTRDYPAADTTTYLGPHLRFGTVSIRQVISHLGDAHGVFLGELIWREFFMQVLFHYPDVVSQNFRPKYNGITWRNHEAEFEKWCGGNTGYPMVDAGMRQLNHTGFMHNRVRMVAASFLCKHLLIDWRWGESYFAEKLLDYELSSNNGNWQWAAGTGCDAAPYFRVFNPSEQMKKFDPDQAYVKKWVPEFGTSGYGAPMVNHPFARSRALETYKKGIMIF
ncbi:MAG TPA: deoxyribodipyrimidine photo-lyase [Bacteroides sp.]|nr:deoxyribodipyrimidine photo-lyase [Bacteroides sp.]